MLSVRCRMCGKELEAHPTKTKCCGCPNMTSVTGDTIGAMDLNEVILLNHEKKIKYHGILTQDDLKYQEDRRKRKVRKLDFEER